MTSVYEILKQLEGTSSKIEKEKILLENNNNETLKQCFYLAYSPTIQFYQKQLPEQIDFPEAIGTLETGLVHLENLYSRVYTGNEAKSYLQQLLFTTQEQDRDVLKRVVLKDMRVGIQSTTINKVWKGLIPKVPQLLASSMKEKSLAKIKFPANADLKADGSRCIAYCSVDGVKLMSRNGKQYQGLFDLETSLSCELLDGYVIDGEIIFDTTKADRSTCNGIVTKAVKGTISQEEQKDIIFQVWDIVPTAHYVEKGKYTVPQDTRFKTLRNLLQTTNLSNVQLIPSQSVDSMEEAKTVFRKYVEEGFEGIILKNKKGMWADKRSPDLVKFKEELFADLKVVGYYEGEGKIKGMLGGLSLESADGVISVNVGSGLTEAQRKMLWTRRDNLIDEIVEVKYNGVVEDKRTGKKSLFLPIFQRFRSDKDEANTYNDMQ